MVTASIVRLTFYTQKQQRETHARAYIRALSYGIINKVLGFLLSHRTTLLS